MPRTGFHGTSLIVDVDIWNVAAADADHTPFELALREALPRHHFDQRVDGTIEATFSNGDVAFYAPSDEMRAQLARWQDDDGFEVGTYTAHEIERGIER